MKHILLPSLAALAFSACLMGPDFKGATAPELPATWVNHLPPSTSETDLTDWWAAFGDPQLSSLINEGFAANPDIQTAALTISRARAALRSTHSGLFPTGSASLGGSNRGDFDSSTSNGQWSGGLSFSWTPDIWGGTRREVEAAVAAVGSSQAAAAATRTALASSIATTYFEWISAQESLRIAREQLVFQENTYEITRKREQNGMASGLDLAQAQSTIASTRAQIPGYEASIRSCENALATYLGTTVDKLKLTMPTPSVYNRIPRVPTGLPAELLRRRPDIVRAEHDLHQANADIGVAVANLFPRISLTGNSSGSARSDFAHFFSNATWNLGATASQSIFNRTTLNENVNIAKLNELASAQNYRKTVLNAFAEVEECLINYAKLTNQLPQHEAAAAASKTAAELSLRQYNSGVSDFLNVASAERSWLSAELNIISTRQQIRMALARLCTALGGGY